MMTIEDRSIITQSELLAWMITKDQSDPLLMSRLLSRAHIATLCNISKCSVRTFFLQHHQMPKHVKIVNKSYLYNMDEIISCIYSPSFKKARGAYRPKYNSQTNKKTDNQKTRTTSCLDNDLAVNFLKRPPINNNYFTAMPSLFNED